MRRDVEFDAEGVTLRGWLYQPDGASAGRGRGGPTVVMADAYVADFDTAAGRAADWFTRHLVS